MAMPSRESFVVCQWDSDDDPQSGEASAGSPPFLSLISQRPVHQRVPEGIGGVLWRFFTEDLATVCFLNLKKSAVIVATLEKKVLTSKRILITQSLTFDN